MDSPFPTEDLINRRTEFRFAGKGLKLDLSLGLFSSAGIDTGSMLLLKTIAGEIDLDGLSTALDVGCGTGTLGLALAARCPESHITMVDRDALAVSFARHNAALNGLGNVSVETRLMTEGPHAGLYDLVISNFPAKAGDPVLKDYLSRSMALCAPGGRGAMVIVHTLADRCAELIADTGGTILLRDDSKQHSVFHYAPVSSRVPDSGTELSLAPYIRNHGEFKVKRTRYELDTVWNIGDFDTLSWRLRLMGEMLDGQPPLKGDALFWEPGQGHLAVMTARRKGARLSRIILAGRDRLALGISRRNLKAAVPELSTAVESLPDASRIRETVSPDGLDFLLTDLSPVPRSEWIVPLKEAAASAVKTGGLWAVLGRSADLSALAKSTKGWTPVSDRRHHGWRALVYRRNG